MERDFIVAAAGAFVGVLGSEAIRWILRKAETSGRDILRWLLLQLKRPFTLTATEIREWRRVSVYRHRSITWSDLPQESKDSVRFHDLSENARDSVKMHQLPQGEKYNLLDKFILPQLRGATFEGTLHLLNNEGSTILAESARVTIPPVEHPGVISQNGMQLQPEITFENPENEIALPRGGRIGFEARAWRMVGNITTRSRVSPGSQSVELWVTDLYFDRLWMFRGAD